MSTYLISIYCLAKFLFCLIFTSWSTILLDYFSAMFGWRWWQLCIKSLFLWYKRTLILFNSTWTFLLLCSQLVFLTAVYISIIVIDVFNTFILQHFTITVEWLFQSNIFLDLFVSHLCVFLSLSLSLWRLTYLTLY